LNNYDVCCSGSLIIADRVAFRKDALFVKKMINFPCFIRQKNASYVNLRYI